MTTATAKAPPPESTLYESVAQHVTRLIEGGTFRVGDRIPSVRRLSQQLDVSITTVLGAYRLLEDRGYIEPRPQSGYFVRAAAPRKIIPAGTDISMSRCECRPAKVSIRELVSMVMHDSLNPNLVQLGAAIPNPKLLPTAKLNRTLARVVRTLPERMSGYAIPPGVKELRVQIARRALSQGCTLTPDEILITSGGQEAISLALRTLCKPGELVALESPCYYGFLQAIELLGLRAIEIPSHPRDGMSLEALELALGSHPVKAVLTIPNYNNPLGSCMPNARKKALVEMLAKREVPLVEDDIYGDLSHEQQRPMTCKSFDKNGLVLLCDSFSKTLAPGLRVGWIAAGKFREQVTYQKLVHSIATATLPQMAIADFLANGGYERHLRKLRRTLARQVRQLGDAVLRHFPDGTRVTRPHGGHVLWVQMPEGVDAMELYGKAVQRGITIAPGPLFSTKGHYRNFVRLNAAFWADEAPVRTLGHLAGAIVG